MGGRVMVYVQHLLGIGHQMRAAAIVRAMQNAGLEVICVSGGEPGGMPDLGGARLIQLPPVRAADTSFQTLVDETGREIDDLWRDARCRALLQAFSETAPDVLLIEGFPFARWQFRFELLPLLAAAREQGVKAAVSIRDIIVPKEKPGRLDRIVAILRENFDLVLVHGDERLVPFGKTFAAADRIADMIRYTGYVAPPPPDCAPEGPGKGEVVVAAGGGAVGGALLRCALAARPMTKLANAPWRLITGPNLPAAEREALKPGPGMTIDTLRTDYREILSRAAVSVSQAGYNTIMDILVTGVRSVLVPFAAGDETEQTLRANLLAARNRACVLPEADLSAQTLAAAIDQAAGMAIAPPGDIALNGAAETAAHIRRILARQPA